MQCEEECTPAFKGSIWSLQVYNLHAKGFPRAEGALPQLALQNKHRAVGQPVWINGPLCTRTEQEPKDWVYTGVSLLFQPPGLEAQLGALHLLLKTPLSSPDRALQENETCRWLLSCGSMAEVKES